MGRQYIEPMQPASSVDPSYAPRGFAVPGLCAICRSWCGDGLCEACLRRFAPARARCLGCARVLAAPAARCGDCLRAPPAFERCITVADYASPWRELIAGFKFRQQIELAGALAAALGHAVDAAGAAVPDLVLPVPLSRERLRERGFNQAWEIARRVARWRRLRVSAALLQRVRDTAHQIGMTRAERERNLRDAFWVDDRFGRRLAGCRVALVDDVLTTGATAQAAALALRRAGAQEVELWVLARTPLDD
jgi:ComF family protein